ncbi:hypothetical protein [Corynebacterium spheniscorum]|uniref:hypothetical protein n=1 Tax=Corynebacterium spheniscorum TaxID=185761 RepID=UPI001160D6FF|nr:hypothetical protein [Corynebacterium spheniscorum]KAA8719425.1 hypothetical protein F4V56_10440 [Corynebacterium spheniscorum]
MLWAFPEIRIPSARAPADARQESTVYRAPSPTNASSPHPHHTPTTLPHPPQTTPKTTHPNLVM